MSMRPEMHQHCLALTCKQKSTYLHHARHAEACDCCNWQGLVARVCGALLVLEVLQWVPPYCVDGCNAGGLDGTAEKAKSIRA